MKDEGKAKAKGTEDSRYPDHKAPGLSLPLDALSSEIKLSYSLSCSELTPATIVQGILNDTNDQQSSLVRNFSEP